MSDGVTLVQNHIRRTKWDIVNYTAQTVKQSAASAARNRIPASADVMIWTVMNMRRSVRIMKLIDLLATIDTDDEKVQICHPGRNWEDYDEFSAGSKLLKPFYDLKVKSLAAINTDVIRVDLDFDEKGGETDE